MRRGGSWTATAVLAGIWLTRCDPKQSHLVPDDLAEYTRRALLAMGGAEARLVGQLQNPMIRVIAKFKERLLLPGICSHYAARKRPIFEQALAANEKVVILGAGFDGLSWRLSQLGRLAVEVDHPATQGRKRGVLDALGADIHLEPVDLGNRDEVAAFFELLPASPAFFVAEAVLMYLPETSVRQILGSIAERGSRVVLTFMSMDDAGRPAFSRRRGLIRQLLIRTGEPFLWGVPLADARAFFNECGFHTETILGGDSPLAQRVEGMIEGEWLAVLSPRD